jgi:adenine deaminase
VGLGVVKNFGTRTGTLASTVSHDCHNLTIVYDTPENALLAANELIRCGGGMCAVEDGKILHTLALPLGGLMSLKPAEELAVDCKAMKAAEWSLGLEAMENPLLRIVTLALPVIPMVKMSDLGMVDVLKKELVPVTEG